MFPAKTWIMSIRRKFMDVINGQKYPKCVTYVISRILDSWLYPSRYRGVTVQGSIDLLNSFILPAACLNSIAQIKDGHYPMSDRIALFSDFRLCILFYLYHKLSHTRYSVDGITTLFYTVLHRKHRL